MEYDLIAREYTGWGLNEIRALTIRERRWWRSIVLHRREKYEQSQ